MLCTKKKREEEEEEEEEAEEEEEEEEEEEGSRKGGSSEIEVGRKGVPSNVQKSRIKIHLALTTTPVECTPCKGCSLNLY